MKILFSTLLASVLKSNTNIYIVAIVNENHILKEVFCLSKWSINYAKLANIYVPQLQNRNVIFII